MPVVAVLASPLTEEASLFLIRTDGGPGGYGLFYQTERPEDPINLRAFPFPNAQANDPVQSENFPLPPANMRKRPALALRPGRGGGPCGQSRTGSETSPSPG